MPCFWSVPKSRERFFNHHFSEVSFLSTALKKQSTIVDKRHIIKVIKLSLNDALIISQKI